MNINTKYDINYEQLYLVVTPIVTVSQFHQKIPNLSKNAAIFPNSAGTGPFPKMTKKIADRVMKLDYMSFHSHPKYRCKVLKRYLS